MKQVITDNAIAAFGQFTQEYYHRADITAAAENASDWIENKTDEAGFLCLVTKWVNGDITASANIMNENGSISKVKVPYVGGDLMVITNLAAK